MAGLIEQLKIMLCRFGFWVFGHLRGQTGHLRNGHFCPPVSPPILCIIHTKTTRNMQTHFIKIDHRIINISSIKSIRIYEEGNIRIFSNVPSAEEVGVFYQFDVDDVEKAQKVIDAVMKMAVEV